MRPFTKNNNTYWICLLFFAISIFTMIWFQGEHMLLYINDKVGYRAFNVSDWMINYEGGFVRRGIIGEILYLIYEQVHYPLVTVIIAIYYISLAIFTYFFSKLLIHRGISVYILPFSICLFASLGVYFIQGRRDYIAFAITGLIFLFYYKLLLKQNKKNLLAVYTLSIFTILMHEASFFFTFPILMLHTLLYYYDKSNKIRCVRKLFIIWLPALVAMIIACHFKGNLNIANTIWASWADCIQRYPLCGDGVKIGFGPLFLSYGLPEALKMHTGVSWNSPMHVILNLYVFIATYYLVTNVNTIDLKWYPLKKIDKIKLSNIMIVQFVSLFPMFGFLSCDWGRTIPYWVISSLMLYCIFRKDTGNIKNNTIVKIITNISIRLQRLLEHLKILRNPLVYLFILISIPLDTFKGPNLWGSFLFIPYDWKLSLWISIKQSVMSFI